MRPLEKRKSYAKNQEKSRQGKGYRVENQAADVEAVIEGIVRAVNRVLIDPPVTEPFFLSHVVAKEKKRRKARWFSHHFKFFENEHGNDSLMRTYNHTHNQRGSPAVVMNLEEPQS